MLLIGCAAPRAAAPQPRPAPAVAEGKEAGPALAKEAARGPLLPADFPADLGGFARGRPYHFPQPGLGYTVPYFLAPTIKINLYIYDDGLGEIPDGVSELAQQRMDQAIWEIGEMERQGVYADLGREPDETPGRLGRRRCLGATFRATTSGGEVMTSVVLTGHRARFLKLRVTYPIADREASQAALPAFYSALGDLLD